METEPKLKLRKNFRNVSLTLEWETFVELNEYTKNFKTISKTEVMRLAVEYCLKNPNFKKILKELDG